jgi:hypothetical protein
MRQRHSLGFLHPSFLFAAAIGHCCLLYLLGAPPTAAAAGLEGFGASAGVFDLAQEEDALELGVDYELPELVKLWRLAPIAGIGATSDEALFAWGGLRRTFELGDSPWTLAPSFAVTVFERGDGKDLGQTLQFRSGIELMYRRRGGLRVGAGYYHISNGSMDDVNPGVNSLLLRVVWSRD